MRRLELPDNVQVTMQVWDIGGQSIFSKMITTYIFEANAVSQRSLKFLTNFFSFLGYLGIRHYELAVVLGSGRLARAGEANIRGA